MPQNSTNDSISFLIGDKTFFTTCCSTPPMVPYDDRVINYLDAVSKLLLSNPMSKLYPDVTTFAFWIRKASLMAYRKSYKMNDGQYILGRGIVFHIAPSNVAVNFAYSLIIGLIAGNVNIVRIPSKQFPQIDLIINAMKTAIIEYETISNYLCLIRYGHDKEINDYLSSLADVRVIWGGDETISTFRASPLNPRSTEVLFANRFSIAVIDSEAYIQYQDKDAIARDFYNDTYLTDQNACSSPKLIVWVGKNKEYAKEEFWKNAHKVISEKYSFQQIQGVDKYLQMCLTASKLHDCHMKNSEDNLIMRISVTNLENGLPECFGNSGLFLEYDAKDIRELSRICNDNRCQTITYIGNQEMFDPLLKMGLKGIDRIVPFGKSMDFELIWDGYDLMSHLTRTIRIRNK